MNNFFINKTILIVGASGYIGSALVNKLLNYKCTIIRTSRDIKKLNKVEKSKSNVTDIVLNSNNNISSDLLLEVDIIFYLSSQTNVYIAQEDVQLDLKNSVEPVLKIFSLLKELNSKPIFVFASAATISGLTSTLPVDETFPDNPITIYDIHKLLIEKYLKFYIETGVVKGAILRLANVYGEGVKSANKGRGILNSMIYKALNNENLSLYGNGEYIRDYVYIEDVIDSFLEVVINIKKTNSKYYYIGSGEGTTIKNAFYSIKYMAKELYNIDIKVENIEMPTNLSSVETRNFYSDSTSFKLDTNWLIKTQLKEGIRKTMKSFKGI